MLNRDALFKIRVGYTIIGSGIYECILRETMV